MSLQQLDSETGWSMEPLYCQLRHHYVITFMRIFWEVVGKDSGAGRDWGQEEKGTTEDEMAGWHHWLDGRWVWVNSRTWWWTGRPGVLRFMGSQRVGRNWVTELNWTECFFWLFCLTMTWQWLHLDSLSEILWASILPVCLLRGSVSYEWSRVFHRGTCITTFGYWHWGGRNTVYCHCFSYFDLIFIDVPLFPDPVI